MPKLPRVSGREAIRAFQRAGWDVARQRGSHVVLIKSGSIYNFPCHSIRFWDRGCCVICCVRPT